MQPHIWHVWSYISCQTFTNTDWTVLSPLAEQMWLGSIIRSARMIHQGEFFRQEQTGTASAVSLVPLAHKPHSWTSSYQCSFAYRCSAWLASIGAPICFTLHSQTNILMDRGRVTWLNFWHCSLCAYIAEKTVTVMERENVCVIQRACEHQCFLWCESVNHVLCSQCKVQNSPVCNKAELQSRNGIPQHSTDSASPGGWIDACACTHSHKQSLISPSRPI